ncbi:AhpC/TSA family protein [Selenihalanaerobacter shriftii]|uniref:AhpC/TSA family protein n=1 Tax=Selenihalanaerobacter shriftii TaxID=142842 RepID=A0A1T4JRN5_9FIRM|nr:AhpC/TSA family protein [Selenihalanaerobacter shriftii]
MGNVKQDKLELNQVNEEVIIHQQPDEVPRTSLPQIGAPAPEFTAMSTFGEVSLSDYRGDWLVLFAHPGDFTPV